MKEAITIAITIVIALSDHNHEGNDISNGVG